MAVSSKSPRLAWEALPAHWTGADGRGARVALMRLLLWKYSGGQAFAPQRAGGQSPLFCAFGSRAGR